MILKCQLISVSLSVTGILLFDRPNQSLIRWFNFSILKWHLRRVSPMEEGKQKREIEGLVQLHPFFYWQWSCNRWLCSPGWETVCNRVRNYHDFYHCWWYEQLSGTICSHLQHIYSTKSSDDQSPCLNHLVLCKHDSHRLIAVRTIHLQLTTRWLLLRSGSVWHGLYDRHQYIV